MTAETLRSLVRNYTSLSKEETDALRTLTTNSPYCQVSHMLMARSSKDQGSPDQNDRLHRAAVYATDRAILKWVMTSPVSPRVALRETSATTLQGLQETSESVKEAALPAKGTESVKEAAAPAKETLEQATKPKKKTEPVTPAPQPAPAPAKVSRPVVTLEGEALRADLAKELSRLQKLKHEFEVSYDKFTHSMPAYKPSPESPKKWSVRELRETSATASGTDRPETPVQSAGRTSEPVEGEPLIEAINTSKKKPKLVTPKVAEQGEIIDNFIKVAPTLPRAKPTQPAVDLSEGSVHHGDNIVSETLVNILLKQGKKDKAIEMLKKLIWKFPQKKAYFAAQIEALKG